MTGSPRRGRWRSSGWNKPRRKSAGCCAPAAVPLTLLLQPRPGLANELGAKVAPVLVPLLDDLLAAEDAIVALRRYSLVTLAGVGRCRCTDWYERSPRIRCLRRWPVSGARPLPP